MQPKSMQEVTPELAASDIGQSLGLQGGDHIPIALARALVTAISKKPKGGELKQDQDGNWLRIADDNTATPITVNGQPLKGKSLGKAGSPEQQFIDEYQKRNPGSSIAQAETAFKAIQPPERAPVVFTPGPNGTFIPMQARMGVPLPAGSMTAGGMSTENETPAAVKARQAQAVYIQEAGDQLIANIQKNRKKIGNLGSYWNQYINGTPIADPDTSGLMAQISSFAALQPALHGFRGSQALAEFNKIIGGPPKNPDALISAIKAIQGTANIVGAPTKGASINIANSPALGGGHPPTVTTKKEFDALPSGTVYVNSNDKQKYTKP